MKLLSAFFIFTLNTFGLNFELFAKIQTPTYIRQEDFLSSKIRSKSNGMFIWEYFYGNNKYGIAFQNSSNNFSYRPYRVTVKIYTNVISTTFQNGKNETIQDEINETITSNISGDLILRTLSQSGALVYEYGTIKKYSQKQKVIGNGKYFLGVTNITINFKRLIKYNQLYNAVSTNEIDNNSIINAPNNSGLDLVGDDDFLNKNVITANLLNSTNGQFIIFYRLTDSDLLSSPNRITLGSSQSGSLTATVNNPEQALLNIQSSTNLIDWNTFKTIKNEPSLEIDVPANKPKEFIRAIE